MSAPVERRFTHLIVERGGGLFMVYREDDRMFERNEAERQERAKRVSESSVDRECSLADLLAEDEYMVYALAASAGPSPEAMKALLEARRLIGAATLDQSKSGIMRRTLDPDDWEATFVALDRVRDVLAAVDAVRSGGICAHLFDSTVCVAPAGHDGPHITSNAQFPHGLVFGGVRSGRLPNEVEALRHWLSRIRTASAGAPYLRELAQRALEGRNPWSAEDVTVAAERGPHGEPT